MSDSTAFTPSWPQRRLTDLALYHNGVAFKPSDWSLDGLPIIRIEQLNNPDGEFDRYTGSVSEVNRIRDGDLVFSWSATLKVVIWRHGDGVLNQHLFKVVPKPGFDARFIYFLLDQSMEALGNGSHGSTMKHIKRSELDKFIARVPPLAKQRKIAAILVSLDTAIEKTEALIEKHQQIKAGLMHDLFTRGVLPNGQLRPPREQVPEMYRDTSIGHMPTDWSVREIGKVVESIVDGPFGSNLKTEHYVVDAGVRVVRLQNVSEAEYDDSDKAYISEQHARCLVRNKVVTGDVLIAGLGDERYPVGRACCYPARTAPAVNKADCFRARCNQDEMRNTFLMLFLNSEMARRQTRRFEQGVTRPRINTGNLKRLNVCVPSLGEQDRIIEQFELARSVAASQRAEVEKLRAQKAGLMQDLLTGRVPVKIADTVAVPA